MERTLKDIMGSLPAARRKAIERGTQELIQEELSLRELRKAHRLTQEQIARELDTSQEVVSRIENRSDLLLSTLRKYVEAAGGKLQLTAKFPGMGSFAITGFKGIAGRNLAQEKVRRKKKKKLASSSLRRRAS